MSDVEVTTNEIYNSKSDAAVYKVTVYTEEETGKIAKDFFDSMEQVIDESRTDLYDETAIYYSTEQFSVDRLCRRNDELYGLCGYIRG